MLSENLTYLRKTIQLSQGRAAAVAGVSRSTYIGYEKGTSEPNASTLIKLAEYFKVTVDEIIRGDLDLPLFRHKKQLPRLQDNDVRILPITVDNHQHENIQYVPEAAIAGYLSEHRDPDYIEQLPHFRLPKLNTGTYRAFDIQGDSMPPLHDGYVLIGRFVELERDLKTGKRYVLVIKEKGIVFKKVVRDGGKRARQSDPQSQFILVSDNPEFTPYTVEVADILEAWEMVAFIGFPDVYQDNAHLLNDRLQVIEQKLNLLNLHL